jgi:hypothetical protein
MLYGIYFLVDSSVLINESGNSKADGGDDVTIEVENRELQRT